MSRRRVAWLALVAGAVAVTTGPAVARADEPEPPTPRQFSMVFTGDILPHVAVNTVAWKNGAKKSYDYRPMFAEIKPLIESADVAVCHMEAPIAPPKTKITGQPVFGAPRDIAASLKDVGYDRCSTASNHSLDRGVAGVVATLDAFDAVGLGHAGTARSADEAVPEVFEVRGVKVAHLAYSYGFNGRRLPAAMPWLANRIDPARILADAADARGRGAEFVAVSLHWGSEYRAKPTADQRKLAQTLTASGLVDLIVGHHAHVIQPIEQINGKWVVFGMGNILSNQRPSTGCPPASQDGVVIRVEVTEEPGGGFTVSRPDATPTWVLPTTYQIFDVRNRVNDPLLTKYTRNQLALSLKRTSTSLAAFVTS